MLTVDAPLRQNRRDTFVACEGAYNCAAVYICMDGGAVRVPDELLVHACKRGVQAHSSNEPLR